MGISRLPARHARHTNASPQSSTTGSRRPSRRVRSAAHGERAENLCSTTADPEPSTDQSSATPTLACTHTPCAVVYTALRITVGVVVFSQNSRVQPPIGDRHLFAGPDNSAGQPHTHRDWLLIAGPSFLSRPGKS